MLDDRNLRARGVLRRQRSPLRPGPRVLQRLEIGHRGRRDRLHPHHQARLVHHLEHVRDATVGLADEPAVTIAVLSEVERDARDTAPPHLVERARAVHVVGHQLAALEALLRDREERDALDAEGRAIDPGEREVHDVLGQVLIAARDEDLVAPDQVVPVGRRGRARLHVREAAAGLGLGEGHRARPLAAVHARHHLGLERSLPNASMRCAAPAVEAQVADGAEVRGHPVQRAKGGDRVGQLLPADSVRARRGGQALLDELRVERLHRRVHLDAVADPVRRRLVDRLVGRKSTSRANLRAFWSTRSNVSRECSSYALSSQRPSASKTS